MKFTEVLQQLGIEARSEGHEHCRDGWIQIDCPFCSPGGRRWRMGYNVSGRYVHCWACGPHRLAETLALITGADVRLMAKLVGQVEVLRHWKPTHTGRLELPKGVGPMLRQHKQYLKRRGYDPDEIEGLWHVQGIGKEAKLSWRLFVPIHYQGEVVSWTTRSLSDKHERRYHSASLSQESLPHKDLLYGEDYLRHSVLVVEGPTDVWRVGPGSVCAFGTSFTKAQVLKLSKYPYRYVCFDNEAGAQRQARRLCEDLALVPGETHLVTLETGKDAASASSSEVRSLQRLVR